MTPYRALIRTVAPLVRFYHRLEVIGAENLPPEGEGFIVAPNHTNWFGWDAIVVGAAIGDRHVRWLSWSYGALNPLWDAAVRAFNGILYNKSRPFPYEELAEKTLAVGDAVGIFPEGNNNTVKDWYRLRPFFPGCVRLAVMSGAPIVPCAIAGMEEAAPILWAKEEEKEPMSFVVGLPFPLPTKVVVHFGSTVRPRVAEEQLRDRRALAAAAREVQLEVLALLKNHRPSARADESC